MISSSEQALLREAQPLKSSGGLLDLVGDARVVLLGEAFHHPTSTPGSRRSFCSTR